MAFEKQPSTLRLGYLGVYDAATNDLIYTTTRSASRFPSFLFSELFVTLTYNGDIKPLATLRLHRTQPTIDIEIDNHKAVLSPPSFQGSRWTFQTESDKWLWAPGSSSTHPEAHIVVLVDCNHQDKRILAQVKKDILSFESLPGGMSDDMRNGIIVSALALYENTRKTTQGPVDVGGTLHYRGKPRGEYIPQGPSGMKTSHSRRRGSPAVIGGGAAAAGSSSGGFCGGGGGGGGGGC